MNYHRISAALFVALAFVMAANVTSQAGTTKREWKETSKCAVTTSLPEFAIEPASCWVINVSGTLNTYQEYQVIKGTTQFIVVSMAVAGHNTVWRRDNMKSIMAAMSRWLEGQEAKFTKAKRRTLPINLWVKRAKHYDVTMKDYGDGCFAFTSVGGGAGSSGSAYQLGVVACNRDETPIDIDRRAAIAESISIKHKLYKEPRSTF